ncbi:MAG: glutathione peroxidase [Microthrixaceae bacterium]
MSIYDHSLNALDGSPLDLHDFEDKTVLIVNVASKCGLTPQYAGLEKIHEQYAARGFSVLGVPCNQFLGQEPGTSEEIATFCSTTYGVTFPLAEKVEVNGDAQHPLYADLNAVEDADGKAGDVTWNFEKFLVAPGGAVTRFRPGVEPEDPALIAAIEASLPA